MKIKKLFLAIIGLFGFYVSAQCNQKETLVICDITKIDFDNNGRFDGIINLYDEYTKLTGKTAPQGFWFDPEYHFVLNEVSGDVYTWDLRESTTVLPTPMGDQPAYYAFELYTNACGSVPAITIQLQIGAFSGYAVPLIDEEVNVQICNVEETLCTTKTTYDLNQTLRPIPTAHKNGIWSYIGNSSNFKGIIDNRYLSVDIPYDPGNVLEDKETFELVYTVPGALPCQVEMKTNVKVSVVRQVFSGSPNKYNICETELIAGKYDNEVNLRDDDYLVNEDIEGVWLFRQDPTGQLSNPGDSKINLKTIYNDLYTQTPRFGCRTYEFNYQVRTRSTVCEDKTSTVKFTFFEYIRPFKQKPSVPEFCVGDESLGFVNLYQYIDFTTENGVLYDYPKSNCTDWRLVSGSSALDLKSNNGGCSPSSGYSSAGTIDLRNLTNPKAGTYVFEYTVYPTYNCEIKNTGNQVIYSKPEGCDSTENPNHPCGSQSGLITIIIHPNYYAGEDTVIEDICEIEFSDADGNRVPKDLISLLKTTSENGAVYSGSAGVWTDLDSGTTITNPYVLPEISEKQTFNFTYSTLSPNGCTDESKLTFTVFEQYQSGTGTTVNACNNEASFDLFNVLTNNPDVNGTWTGPDGFTTTTPIAVLDPATAKDGDYIYEVPANGKCNAQKATVSVKIHKKAFAGDDVQATVCQSDKIIDLKNHLDPKAEAGGSYVDINNYGVLNGSLVDVSNLSGDYSFEYQIPATDFCTLSKSTITLTVNVVNLPVVSDQSFCITKGTTITDLQFTHDETVEWFESNEAPQPIMPTELVRSNQIYFAQAKDANGCISARVPITVTLRPVGNGTDCPTGIPDVITENTPIDLTLLGQYYPNFEFTVFNRYGTMVYKGVKDTAPFTGKANVGISNGQDLISGVYFYVFNTNDGQASPFNGEIFLSR